jgi:CHAT domain-containing protein
MERLAITIENEAYLVPIPFFNLEYHTTENGISKMDAPDAYMLSGEQEELFSILSRLPEIVDEKNREAMTNFCGYLIKLAVEKKGQRRYSEAYFLYRLPLFFIFNVEQPGSHLDIIVYNVWQLYVNMFRSILGYSVLSRNLDAYPDLQDTTLEPTRRILHQDFNRLAGLLQEKRRTSFQFANFLTEKRFVTLCGDTEAASNFLLLYLEHHSNIATDSNLLLAVIEQLVFVDKLDLLQHAGMINGEIEKYPFPELWQIYLNNRDIIYHEQDAKKMNYLLTAITTLHDRLHDIISPSLGKHASSGMLRITYGTSYYLQIVGQDLFHLHYKRGEISALLEKSERTKGISLINFMTRSHNMGFGYLVNPKLPGSMNAGVQSASAQQIYTLCLSQESPFIFFIKDKTGYIVVLLTLQGELLSEHIEVPENLVKNLFESLGVNAKVSSLEKLDINRGIVHWQLDKADRKDRLNRAFNQLFPTSIWDKIVESGATKLTIIPSGDLALFPFSALVTNDGKYLVENYELVNAPAVTIYALIKDDAFLYKLHKARYKAYIAQLNGEKNASLDKFIEKIKKEDESKDYVFIGGVDYSNIEMTYDDEVMKIDYLEGTLNESIEISKLFNAKPFTGLEATKASLIENGQGAKIIHIGTHGMFDVKYPLQSCLVFADGILTAADLYEMDTGLRGRFILLSACQTGLGENHPDSLIGLASAFLVAGANTVVSTLWNIPDEVTSRLMIYFYQELKKGSNVATTLQAAQKYILSHPEWSDPFYWAAFVVNGSVANPLT